MNEKEDKPYARACDVFTYITPKPIEQSVAELFDQIESLKYHLNSWAFPSQPVVVVTRGPRDGCPLVITVFNFDYSVTPVAIVERDAQLGVRFTLIDERFTEPALKFFMWGVLQLWKLVPWYDPDNIKAPAGFTTETKPKSGSLEKDGQ